LVGGLTGLVAGVLVSHQSVAAATATMVVHGALWGSWYGLAYAIITDTEHDPALAAALVGGNAGLLLALPVARAWRPTPSQVWIASAGGVAGGLAGLGAALLTEVGDERASVGMMAAGTTLGLIAGVVLGRDRDASRFGSAGFQSALLAISRERAGEEGGSGTGWRIGLPLPVPTALPAPPPPGRSGRSHEVGRLVPGIQLRLLEARF
jgi:hypothetical protein